MSRIKRVLPQTCCRIFVKTSQIFDKESFLQHEVAL